MVSIKDKDNYLKHMRDIGYSLTYVDGTEYMHDPAWYKVDANGDTFLLEKNDIANDPAITRIMRDIAYDYVTKKAD